MKLFKYEGYEVRVSPEALALKPFKDVWSRDRSKSKEKAMMELSFLYFYCDPRSDYQYILDDSSRMEAVKNGLGFPDNWKPDAVLSRAVTYYKTFDTHASMLLRAASEGVEKVQKLIKDLEPDDTKSLKEYLMALKMIPEVASMLRDAEKAINDESEYGEARGSIEKTLFDDGLPDM